MMFSILSKCLPARMALALGLVVSLCAGTAAAQGAKAAPVATSTLDVCADEASGNWRYSGVVSVLGADGASVTVTNRIQNQTSRAGFVDIAQGKSAASTGTARSSGAVVLPYAFSGAPRTLGVLRSTSQVQVGTSIAALLAQSDTVTADTVCGCAPKGCVRTQGYWSNKPGVIWPAPYNRNALFFSSGLTWQQVLDSPVRGNAYFILAHQYIAAVLNRAAGASAPSGVQSVINAATAWFRSGVTLSTCGPGQCALQKNWAGTLDVYNNGEYPGAPKHCD
jgi:hypothetical protein